MTDWLDEASEELLGLPGQFSGLKESVSWDTDSRSSGSHSDIVSVGEGEDSVGLNGGEVYDGDDEADDGVDEADGAESEGSAEA